jgi:preprotein translocase subunit YajC
MLNRLMDRLWMYGPGLAADAPAGPVNPQAELLKMVVPLALMFVVLYVMLIRPQQRKAKDHQNLLGTLKSKDRVVTNSGLLGEVISIREKSVTLRCGESKLEVLKSSIAEIVERAQSAPEAKS